MQGTQAVKSSDIRNNGNIFMDDFVIYMTDDVMMKKGVFRKCSDREIASVIRDANRM